MLTYNEYGWSFGNIGESALTPFAHAAGQNNLIRRSDITRNGKAAICGTNRKNLLGKFHISIRCFDETVFIDSCIACEVGDKTDVRTFRGLDRAHTAIVAVVYVSNFESGTVS